MMVFVFLYSIALDTGEPFLLRTCEKYLKKMWRHNHVYH
ncbi:protein of unknown function [Candidatus Nitrosotalea okcheonensis]|uniref:Uncharacterized protein n=1 Tax=Candidatus Nitrosotalea okcheonensis TaxID=1903276 RepID=A0A2H1FDJ6_9ARCH|nr:protein of unknown function [Candidatus Nitrosotalea okcheonensis]